MLEKLKGKSIEIFGEYDCGKTKFALSLIEKDDICLFIDADRKIYNISNNIFVYQENNIENIYETLYNIIKYLDVVIIDSIAILKTKKYDIYSNFDNDIFNILKKIINLCKKNNCTIIFINQKRYNYETESFGHFNLYNYYSLRIEIENKKPNIVLNKLNKKIDLYNIFL